jgi:hypothetical protein
LDGGSAEKEDNLNVGDVIWNIKTEEELVDDMTLHDNVEQTTNSCNEVQPDKNPCSET